MTGEWFSAPFCCHFGVSEVGALGFIQLSVHSRSTARSNFLSLYKMSDLSSCADFYL